MDKSTESSLALTYWKKKILNRDKIVLQPNKKIKHQVGAIAATELNYFNKITNKNLVAKLTVISATYFFFLKRLLNEFDGYVVSNLEGYDSPLLLSSSTNLKISFKEYLQKIKQEILQTLDNYDYEILTRKIGFNDLNILSNYSINVNANTKLDCNGILFDIKINSDESIEMCIYYLEGFIKEIIVKHLVKCFKNFLVNLENNIEVNLSKYSLLNENEKQELLIEFNNTKSNYPRDKTIINLFEEQVKKTPDNIATLFNGKKLTFWELNEKANQLANYISSKYDIRKGDVVGVFLPKSDISIISLLSVLKLGAIYLPIDTNYPKERINYLINDSQLKLLLINQNRVDSSKCEVIDISSINIFDFDKKNVNKEILPNDVAYIIYTSGSTGLPKGVMVQHKSNINMSLHQIKHFKICEQDKVVWFAATAFDASISEIMMSLYSGCTLCIPTEEIIKNNIQFVSFLKKTKSTVVTFPPSYLALLSKEDLNNIRCIITAGEPAISSKAFEIVKSGIDYYNAYGPTECAVCVSIYKVTKSDYDKSIISIGKPIGNTQIYILDESNNLTPIGVVGKMYVSGIGVAKGYLNNSELTSQKFILNPFIEGEIMYDTGDLGCWLPDGNIEFGRKDQQVKIHGYRVELGEIENTILQFSEELKQIVVEIKENNQEKVLVAYLVAKNIDKSALRNFLQEKLPSYMVPSFYVLLSALPITPNGKIDRKALPDISQLDLMRRAYIVPRNETEFKIAEIWRAVLGIEKVGITDNFFELGGHSLIVAQVINRIYKQLDKTIPIKVFFANPTIEGISEQLQINKYFSIPKAPIAPYYPVTASQSRFWILSQLEGGSAAYNMPAAVKLTGTFDAIKFEESFNKLIARHEILRTFFKANSQGEICQYIIPAKLVSFKIAQKDFSSEENQQKAIADYLEEKNKEPFDLKQAPLIRASLIKLKEKEHIFFLSLHHIIGDGWSIEILISEIVKIYNLLIQGKETALPELSIRYKDYAVWLNGELQKEKQKASEQYWLQQFRGELPALELPSFKKRPIVQTYNGDSINYQFSNGFLEQLKAFSKEHKVTLFMSLVAGINTLLHRYTNQADIIIGTPIAGRTHPDLEKQIGLYLNILAIRTELKEKICFLELIQKEKETLLGAYEHQEYPFDMLVNKLNLKRDTSRNALFDAMIVLQSQEQLNNLNNDGLIDLELSNYNFISKTSQLDICFTFFEKEALNLTIESNTDIYDRCLIERMFSHFENLLTQMLIDPKRPIQEINYITQHERHQLLEEFNTISVGRPENKTIIHLFEEQVERTPNNIAVVFDEVELTYKELNEQSNQLASYLKTKYNIQPDNLVGIKLDRGEKMIIAILGILKSGAAYVPIDINYPQERITYIEKDSNVKAVIDQNELEIFFQGQEQYSIFNIDKINTPKDLAYIIYTSGTTGNPKGVMVEHFNVVSIFESWKKHYQLDLIDVNLLQLASISFDVFMGDICRSILNGGKMIICSNDIKLNTENLYELMQKRKISIIEGTPSVLLPLMHYIYNEQKEYSFLKMVIFGSDTFNNQEYNNLKDKFSKDIKIINSYGVTEATIDSTYYDGYKKELEGTTPIGKPFSNSKILILDSNHNVTPIGVYGEIYIGGNGLSRGYYNQEVLTSEKFILNPNNEKERLYKTGDLGRWLADGNIDFKSRMDNQVKIRGYRIELGEIETTIAQYSEDIKQVIVGVKSVNADKALVVYIVSNLDIDKSKLRNYLQNRLPEYMVPGFYVILNSLPLTPNGKIDRNALPNISNDDIIRKPYIAPRNETEEKLVNIWQEVLGVEKISVTDNFFELGGHSLKITKLLNNVNSVFRVVLSFNDLFSNMILEKQSELILKATQVIYHHIPKIPHQPSYPLSFAQRRLWLLSQFEGGSVAYNMQSIFEIDGNLSIPSLGKAFFVLIERHESLRTIFNEDENGEIRQFILHLDHIKFQLQFEDISNTTNSIKEIIQKETGYSFDLTNDSLLRAKLVKTSSNKYVFIFVMHHIMSDAWSTEIITNELFKLYTVFTKGEHDSLPLLRIQYKDYTAWQQNLLKESRAEVHKKYWFQQFQGELPIIDLPAFQKRPSIKTYNGQFIKKCYDATLLKDLTVLCQSQGCTLFMGLLTTVKILLNKYTSQQDIIVGSPIAGREHLDLQNQVGFYVNTLALRTQFEVNESFKELLLKVKKVTLEAYEHQIYPFDELVDQLPIKRDMSRNPLFDVMVTLQNTDNLDVDIDAIEEVIIKEYIVNENSVSKVDIEFIFEETDKGLSLIVVYNTDIYLKDFIESMVSHIEKLLGSIILDSEKSIGMLEYLSESEREELLLGFNRTSVEYSREVTVLDLFLERVKNNPDKVAVRDEGNLYTYQELDRLSSQIGYYLLSTYGYQDKSPIGVLLDRSATMLAVLLGILKTGRPYIPLDPTFPKDRLDYIIKNSESQVIISNQEDKVIAGIIFLPLETLLEKSSAREVDFVSGICRSDTAYIIYTSGTTGHPKGVEIGHGSLVNFLISMHQRPGIGLEDILFSVTTYSFDISILEFFGPLISGASVYIASQGILTDPELIIEKIEESGATLIQGTPSFFQLLLNAGWEGNKRLKVWCGGDLLSQSLSEKLLLKSMELWNMYGPTETTIWSSIKRIEDARESRNIGKGINNTQLYILDEYLNLQAIGVAGNIYIGGTGLAKGYYKNESLTMEKFIKNPFFGESLLYLTGDKGRWNREGEIEFLGRDDNQVKIRGYRIELAEIETVLLKIPQIDSVVVSVKTDNYNNKLLVSYLTSNTDIDILEIKSYLKKCLPHYMIPSHFIKLEKLPLTPNGKIDRSSLPNPENIELLSDVEFVLPRNEIEERLLKIWEHVLSVKKISVKDDFFELGGQSISATKLISAIHKEFEVKVSINDLFKNMVLENQAIFIENILSMRKVDNKLAESELEIENFSI